MNSKMVYVMCAVLGSGLGLISMGWQAALSEHAVAAHVQTATQARPLSGRAIWTFAKGGHPAAVETALQTGLFTHVAIFVGYAGNPHSDTIDTDNVREAIHIAKRLRATVILCGLLFDPSGATRVNLYDSDYLAGRISLLRTQANERGADEICFDVEVWGNPLKTYMRGNEFSGPDFDRMNQAIGRATAQAGLVDYITPAGRGVRKVDGKDVYRFHPYNALRKMGFHRVCQQTYFADRPSVTSRIDPSIFDIVGLFVSTTRDNPLAVDKPYYTAADVLFRRREAWEGRSGLWVWTERKDLEVSWEFSEAVR